MVVWVEAFEKNPRFRVEATLSFSKLETWVFSEIKSVFYFSFSPLSEPLSFLRLSTSPRFFCSSRFSFSTWTLFTFEVSVGNSGRFLLKQNVVCGPAYNLKIFNLIILYLGYKCSFQGGNLFRPCNGLVFAVRYDLALGVGAPAVHSAPLARKC